MRAEGKEEILEDIDEMLSAIDNGDDISNFDIPERIKRESRVTERLLNFYVTLLGGFTTARGDSFYLRLFKPELLESFSKDTLKGLLGSELQLDYFGHMLIQYATNGFYYSYIDENIRAGNNKFAIPLKKEHQKSLSNFSVIKLYTEAMIASFLQDLLPKETKLTIKNAQLLEMFRTKFGSKISEWLKLPAQDFLAEVYAPSLGSLHQPKKQLASLYEHYQEQELVHLKDALYRLDFWLTRSYFEQIKSLNLKKDYDNQVVLTMLGTMRESLFGLALLFTALQDPKRKIPSETNELLLMLYLRDILGIRTKKADTLLQHLEALLKEFAPFLELRIGLDDNPAFFDLIAKNWRAFIKGKAAHEIFSEFSAEDVMRFRGLLKNIAYYNKRFVIPR